MNGQREESEIKPKKHFPSIIGGQLPSTCPSISISISISIRISISIPHSHRHWYLFSLCSWKRSFACRNAVGHEMENEGQHKLKITEKPRIRIREIESKERKSRRRSVLWSCSFIYERLRWLSAVFPPNCPYDRVFHTPTL